MNVWTGQFNGQVLSSLNQFDQWSCRVCIYFQRTFLREAIAKIREMVLQMLSSYLKKGIIQKSYIIQQVWSIYKNKHFGQCFKCQAKQAVVRTMWWLSCIASQAFVQIRKHLFVKILEYKYSKSTSASFFIVSSSFIFCGGIYINYWYIGQNIFKQH